MPSDVSHWAAQATTYYFAYGSNMNPERVATRGLQVGRPRRARLFEVELRFDKQSRDHKGYGHANIRAHRGGVTEGVLYPLATPEEIFKMDPFERAPINYGREVVRVVLDDDTSVWAWTYFANAAVLADGLRPPADYLAHLLAGAEFLSPDYLRWLSGFADTGDD